MIGSGARRSNRRDARSAGEGFIPKLLDVGHRSTPGGTRTAPPPATSPTPCTSSTGARTGARRAAARRLVVREKRTRSPTDATRATWPDRNIVCDAAATLPTMVTTVRLMRYHGRCVAAGQSAREQADDARVSRKPATEMSDDDRPASAASGSGVHLGMEHPRGDGLPGDPTRLDRLGGACSRPSAGKSRELLAAALGARAGHSLAF